MDPGIAYWATNITKRETIRLLCLPVDGYDTTREVVLSERKKERRKEGRE